MASIIYFLHKFQKLLTLISTPLSRATRFANGLANTLAVVDAVGVTGAGGGGCGAAGVVGGVGAVGSEAS